MTMTYRYAIAAGMDTDGMATQENIITLKIQLAEVGHMHIMEGFANVIETD